MKQENGSKLPQWENVDPHEFSRLIRHGKVSGQLSLDEILEVLRDAELMPSLVAEVREALEKEGISLDDQVVAQEGSEPQEGEMKIILPPKRNLKRRRNKKNVSEKSGSSDSTQRYLSEIGEVTLLEPQEEVDLAMEMRDGMEAEAQLAEFHATGKLENLSRVELSKLRRRQRRGEQARDRLTRANLRLVVSIAKKHVGRGLPLLDLVQEGNLGLMRAVEKFDGTKGYKFSTYATWWIRQAITRSIADQARTIRIPVHMIETINKIVRTTRQIMAEIGREPTPNELADRLHMPLDKVKKVLKIAKEPISLETPVGDEEDSSLGDFIEDKNALIPIEAAVKSSLRDTTTSILSSLTPREERVLRMRFGIGMNSDHTLEEVGQQFSVTRERIRQIEAKALRKLKHPTRARKLKTFLDE